MRTKVINFLIVFALIAAIPLFSGFKNTQKTDKDRIVANGSAPGSAQALRFTDHRLPNTSNLPANGSLSPVSVAMSTFQTYGLIGRYFNGSSTIDDYIEELRVYKSLSTTNDAINYINTSGEFGLESFIEWTEFRDSLFYLGTGDVEDAIDDGNPLISFHQNPTTWVWSVVMITGYNTSGTIEYFDATTGYYGTDSPGNFYNANEVTGLK
ncbi:MAG TPA: hypothetical protein VK541_02375 [Pedobacter sp.]|uniref:hypothetical protein n=1 Tax=Pedobacter sp. TaxID=1411316 RepID=UPI002B8FFB30|nr:hypothetical protein [Pedobacter sp.]HMI01297.1 hypothetical protein [Pedobacter sp.]